MAFVLAFIVLRIILGAVLSFCVKVTGWTCCKNTRNTVLRNIFYSVLIKLPVEMFYEFYLVTYLAYLRFVWNSISGEVVSFALVVLVSLLTYLLLPVVLIWFVAKKPTEEELNDEEFKKKWLFLYEDIRSKSRWQLSYILNFVLRRLTFMALAIHLAGL